MEFIPSSWKAHQRKSLNSRKGDSMSIKAIISFLFGFFFLSGIVPVMASPPCHKANLLLVLDKSGSMKQSNKWSTTQTELSRTLQAVEHRLRLGLITFSDQAKLDFALGGDVKALETNLQSTQPAGATYMKKAMQQAITHLQQSLAADSVKKRPTYVLLITDGAPTDRCPEDEVKQLRSLKVGTQTHDVKTFILGFGQQVNALCLNSLAVYGGTSRTGKERYYVVSEANHMNQALQQVVQSATSLEVCNGMDDDCDGFIDNVSGKNQPMEEVCQKGLCQGSRQCVQGAWSACTPTQAPTAEVCDGKDNDCDGFVDNVKGQKVLLSRSCQHACGTLKQSCVWGQWTRCSSPSIREVCDGKDNDCDGKVDEDLVRACDHCSQQVCQKGVWSACTKNTKPAEEICNGFDDDCDGYIDNAPGTRKNDTLTRICLPPADHCGEGVQQCSNGKYGACIAPKPSPEICDGKDNDCNGIIDDPWQEWVGKDSSGACQTACGQGVYQCKPDGSGVICSGQGKWKELCDGKDNDCNGLIDELWPKKGQACTVSEGSCQGVGVQVCNATQDGLTCQPTQTIQPSEEVCDGKDNDCDGQTDEDLVRACAKDCKAGTQRCHEGSWTSCNISGSTISTCPPTKPPEREPPKEPEEPEKPEPEPTKPPEGRTDPPSSNNNNAPPRTCNSNGNNCYSSPPAIIRILPFGCGCTATEDSSVALHMLPVLLLLFGFFMIRRN